jgi:hypothetical protein
MQLEFKSILDNDNKSNNKNKLLRNMVQCKKVDTSIHL